MARPLRIEFPGAIHHVTTRTIGGGRGGEANRLFIDDADRRRFLERLGERVTSFGVRLHLYCLMSNHLHLVVETPTGNLGAFLQSLLTAYTVSFNRRHDRHGHVFDGRYKAKLVEGDQYLGALSRYVHLNPVSSGVIAARPLGERRRVLREYRWSSYPAYVGDEECPPFLDRGPLLAMMGGPVATRARRYRSFVEEGLARDDAEFAEVLDASPLAIGGEAFRARVHRLHEEHAEQHPRPEDVSLRRVSRPIPPAVVLDLVADELKVMTHDFRSQKRDSPLRGIAGAMLCRFGGLTQREAAKILGLRSGSALSHQIASLRARLAQDAPMRDAMRAIEARLEASRGPEEGEVGGR